MGEREERGVGGRTVRERDVGEDGVDGVEEGEERAEDGDEGEEEEGEAGEDVGRDREVGVKAALAAGRDAGGRREGEGKG